MAGTLKSEIFLIFQHKFQENCISLFIDAYYESLSLKSIYADFYENDITAILHNYIDQNPNRKKWKISSNLENYIFNEGIEYSKGFAAKFSRIDLRYSVFWKDQEFKYFIEAKNLKANESGSKRRYITTGINNFLENGKYFNCDGFLVGYILEGSIENCVDGINKLLQKDKRNTEIIEKKLTYLSKENYFSKHKEKEIFHLFLNYAHC